MSTKAPPKKTTISFRILPKDKKEIKKLVRDLLTTKGYNLYETKTKKSKPKKQRRSAHSKEYEGQGWCQPERQGTNYQPA